MRISITCDHCGSQLVINRSIMLRCYPGQYQITCPNCYKVTIIPRERFISDSSEFEGAEDSEIDSELEAYRAIGTLDECRKAMDICKKFKSILEEI